MMEEIGAPIARTDYAIKCKCGGFAEQVDATPEEDREYGCGRPMCCSAAFVCAICGTRWVGSREAPEME